MKLKNVEITNFRCFESLSLDLDEQLTVLVAKNGQGKSSLLDAIRIGLWSFVSGFSLAKNPNNNICVDDIRISKIGNAQLYRHLPCKITLLGDWNITLPEKYSKYEKTWAWTRFRDSDSKRAKTKNTENSKIITALVYITQHEATQINPSIDLPVLGYYGTGRLWSEKKLTENKKAKKDNDVYMRLFAYRDCLDPASSYKHFSDWFVWVFECYREEQIRHAEKGALHESNPKWKETILVVQQAINDVLQAETGWHDLEYSVSDEKSLVLNHPDYGKLKVEQLSDGIRGILAMVGDIAYRCVKLNWHLGANAAKETHGVVMIDEIELHLHPAWQQTILSNLCEAFPKIQFIVTTHSPQVLSTIHRKSIRLLGKDTNGKDVAVMPIAESYGELSSDVLQSIMHVNPQPPVAEKSDLEHLTALVDQGLYNTLEATTLFNNLKAALSETHPQLQKLARSIKRQELLKA